MLRNHPFRLVPRCQRRRRQQLLRRGPRRPRPPDQPRSRRRLCFPRRPSFLQCPERQTLPMSPRHLSSLRSPSFRLRPMSLPSPSRLPSPSCLPHCHRCHRRPTSRARTRRAISPTPTMKGPGQESLVGYTTSFVASWGTSVAVSGASVGSSSCVRKWFTAAHAAAQLRRSASLQSSAIRRAQNCWKKVVTAGGAKLGTG